MASMPGFYGHFVGARAISEEPHGSGLLLIAIPKGPCRYMVYTLGPKRFPYTYFEASVCNI